MAAVDDAVAVVVVSAPPPEPAPRRVTRVLLSLCLASLWISSAATAAGTVARRALGMDSPVCLAFFITMYVGAFLCVTLLVVAHCLVPSTRFRSRLNALVKEIPDCCKHSRQILGASVREKDPAVLGMLACFLLLIVGLLVGAVPVEECLRIGIALFDLGVLGVSAIFCLIVIPCLACKLWKTKKVCCSVAISETKTIREDVKDQHEAELPELKFADV